MLEAVFALARPLLNFLDPERAHELTLRSMEVGIYPRSSATDDGRLAANVWGLAFPNPLGIAAGFDKDAPASPAIDCGTRKSLGDLRVPPISNMQPYRATRQPS